MKELMHRLFSFSKPEVHRVLVPRINARCLKVTWPTGEQQPKIAHVESELAITPTIRRLNMKAVAFESLAVFLSSCHLLSPQIDAVPIESIDCATTKAGYELIIPSIFSYANPWRINIFRADRFKLKHATVQCLSLDDFKGSGLSVISHNFLSPFAIPNVSFFVDRTCENISAQVNKIDSNEIVLTGGFVGSFESHLDESTTVKIESVLQLPNHSISEVSKLLATLIKFDKLDDITIRTKFQVVEIKIVSTIQSWRDFPLPFKLKIINRTNAVILPVFCERYGISWRFIHENGDECLDFNIHSSAVWFKLSDESLNRGRLAKNITDGIYLLVVPRNWECSNVTSSCFVFNEQEFLTVDHWRGYLIHVNKSSTDFPLFKTSSGVKKICGWKKLLLSRRTLTHLELQRLRWGIADEYSDTTRINWQKKPIEIEESRFTATSSEALWVDIPKAVHIDSIYAGFKPRKLRRKKGIFPIALREFYDAVDLHQNRSVFYLWIRDSIREHAIPMLKIKTKAWHCKHADCLFVSPDWALIEFHYRDIHPEYGFKALRYSEAQARSLYGNEFPARIYQCGYNPQHFVNASTLAFNPTSAIINHIEHGCNEARAQTHGDRPQVRFSVVEDVEKIRSTYLSNLPIWVKCLFCEKFFKKSGNNLEEGFFIHLMKLHQNKLFEQK